MSAKQTFDVSRVSRNTLVALAAAADLYERCPTEPGALLGMLEIIKLYRAEGEIPPPRTESQIDRDVAQLIYDCWSSDGSGFYMDSSIKALLRQYMLEAGR
jgi:hypothetical protein